MHTDLRDQFFWYPFLPSKMKNCWLFLVLITVAMWTYLDNFGALISDALQGCLNIIHIDKLSYSNNQSLNSVLQCIESGKVEFTKIMHLKLHGFFPQTEGCWATKSRSCSRIPKQSHSQLCCCSVSFCREVVAPKASKNLENSVGGKNI